jgi:hypothetical protein
VYGLFFSPKDGSNALFQYVGKLPSDHMASHARKLILRSTEIHLRPSEWRYTENYVFLNIVPTSELRSVENVHLTGFICVM